MASIQERENKSGASYRVIWRDDGRQKVATFKSEDKARRWKQLIEHVGGNEAEADRRLAQTMDTGPTLTSVYDHYMERHRGTPKTLQEYASYWRNHISSPLGTVPVGQIRDDDIRALVATMETRGLAPKTINNVGGYLGQLLKHAVDYEWIKRSPWNAKLLPKSRSERPEQDKFLTRTEAALIIEAMSSHQDAAKVLLATGLRPGELCALDVGDVNLDIGQPTIRVNKAVKQDRVKGDYIGVPKSERSVRTIGLPPSTARILRRWVEDRRDNEPLFTQATGPGKDAEQVRLRRKRIYQGWQRTVERLRAGGELSKKPALYALRHTHASLMIASGMELYQLSRHMGHSSISVTEKHYLHLMPDAHYIAAGFAAKALEG